MKKEHSEQFVSGNLYKLLIVLNWVEHHSNCRLLFQQPGFDSRQQLIFVTAFDYFQFLESFRREIFEIVS